MLFSGVIILLGTIIPALTFTSFVIATMIFIGFAIGRSLSIINDGKPNKHLKLEAFNKQCNRAIIQHIETPCLLYQQSLASVFMNLVFFGKTDYKTNKTRNGLNYIHINIKKIKLLTLSTLLIIATYG